VFRNTLPLELFRYTEDRAKLGGGREKRMKIILKFRQKLMSKYSKLTKYRNVSCNGKLIVVSSFIIPYF
jgi:hypothetical protein